MKNAVVILTLKRLSPFFSVCGVTQNASVLIFSVRSGVTQNASVLGFSVAVGGYAKCVCPRSANSLYYCIIIQQIVTLSKYGHDALDICHP